jgi:hypothetical protein
MTTSNSLFQMRSYLASLPAHEQESIMSELQDHLDDQSAALSAQGLADPAAAFRAFGDPAQVGARLADVHTRPSPRQALLAVLPFLLSGLVLPALVYVIVAADSALGDAPRIMRIMDIEFSHAPTLAAFFAVIAVVYGLFAAGALKALQHGLPLWTAAWAGGGLLTALGFVVMLFDEASAAESTVGGFLFLVACAAGLVFVARRCSTLLSLLIALSFLIQCGIIAAYIISTPPVSQSALAVALAVGIAAAGALAIASALLRLTGYRAMLLLAAVVSIVPYTIQLALTVDAMTLLTRMLANVALPAILLLLPLLLVHRRAATR